MVGKNYGWGCGNNQVQTGCVKGKDKTSLKWLTVAMPSLETSKRVERD